MSGTSDSSFTMTATFGNGLRLEVPCYETQVPGLVLHEVVLEDLTLGPDWVLALQSLDRALVRDHPFLTRGEACYAASLLAPLCDWTQPPDPGLLDDVRIAFTEATGWRSDASGALRELVRTIGDEIVRTDEPTRHCNGRVHRVAFGWGYAYARPTGKTGERSLVLRFSSDGEEDNARTVWNYEPDGFVCLDCGTEV